jgi:copper chaperone NosL
MAVANLRVVPGSKEYSPALPDIRSDAAVGIPVAASNKVGKTPRLLVLVAAVLMIGVYLFPLWNVRLTAPQYPEGLGMHIRVNTVEGATENDLNNINNLNHYIGMKRIEPESIPELRYMPWIVAAVIVTGLATAAIARRKLVYAWTAGFVLVALAGLVDFWKWEYDYGHHLDNEHAVLKIPGMTYQPPLIGAKQLLNFRATSWPAAGGVIAGIALALAVLAVVLAWREQNARRRSVEPRPSLIG